MATKLPPLQGPPKRSLSPPAQKAMTRLVEEDAPTPTRNETAATFQSLLSVFDELSQGERFAFIELARLFVELGPHERTVAIVALRKLAGR